MVRPRLPGSQLSARLAVCLFAALGLNCGAGGQGQNTGSGGAGAGSGGAVSGGGGSGGATTTGAAGSGGASGAGTGGGSAMAGTGGTPGGFDDGRLFADASAVSPTGSGGSASDAGPVPGVDAGRVIPGDGNMATCTIPAIGLTAVFTQTGEDVTVVVDATRCPPGNHLVQMHEGFACDDPTNGPVWGGQRGVIGMMTCDATQRGSLTHTRTAANPALKWTVGDQNLTTDVTQHPMKVMGRCGTFF